MNWEIRNDIYTIMCTMLASGKLLLNTGSSDRWDGGGGSGGQVQEGGDISPHRADSLLLYSRT